MLYCPADDSINRNRELDALRNFPNGVIARCSYFYRQLDCRRTSDASKGRLGGLGRNPGIDQISENSDDADVRAIAADRNFLGYRDAAGFDATVRTSHDGTTTNILFEDGHVESILNQYPNTVNDLRLDMLSAPNPRTMTTGFFDAESARVWVLLDNRQW